jgi:predicted glycosyl hydrolase (DUF1957 family)
MKEYKAQQRYDESSHDGKWASYEIAWKKTLEEFILEYGHRYFGSSKWWEVMVPARDPDLNPTENMWD